MRRVEHDLLKDFPVTLSIPVAWGEMDAMGHVNHTVYLRYCETARMLYGEAIGLHTFMAVTGIGPILKEITCRYRRPLVFPDQVLVGVRTLALGEFNMDMDHCLVSERMGKVVAEVRGSMVSFDYRAQRKVPLPMEWRQAIEAVERIA